MHSPEEVKPIFFKGKIAVLDFDPENPENLEHVEKALREFTECEEGEKLYVSLSENRLEVKKLKKED